MRLATVEVEGRTVWGRVEDGLIIDSSGLAPDLKSFLASGGGQSLLRDHDGEAVPLEDARWLPPIPNPGKIWCVGLNFDDYRRLLGLDFLNAPNIFLKAPSALVGHGSSVGVPVGYGTVFHEWELTAVVGRTLREATPEEAEEAIFGYTILDDLVMHELELVNRDHQQWAKNIDGFAPCGPWIVTSDELDVRAGMTMRRWRNGELQSQSSTSEMRHQHDELLAFISTFSTLEPGDLVPGGTPPAGPCGAGDEIVGEIEGIGSLAVQLVERHVDDRWRTVLEKED